MLYIKYAYSFLLNYTYNLNTYNLNNCFTNSLKFDLSFSNHEGVAFQRGHHGT